MATAPVYCTHVELKRVFPQVKEFDGKTPVYGWVLELTDWYDSSLDLYYSADCGLVSQLFYDGSEVDKIAYNTIETTQLDGALTPSAEVFYVDADHGLAANDIVKIDDEYIRIVSVSDDTITISTPATNRGIFGTSAQHHLNNAKVYRIIDVSADVSDSASSTPVGLSFVYDTHLDLCILISTSNPSDNLVEAGEDFTDLVTQFRTDASRYLDSKLAPDITSEQRKDKYGNYDYLIVRTTALIAASFMIKTKDPTSEMATSFMEEVEASIASLNNGEAALSWQVTSTSSKGVIKEGNIQSSLSLAPVELKGRYSGTYDLIRIAITTSGHMGHGKYSVWVKNSEKLGISQGNLVIDDKIINGDFQPLAGGLEVRFSAQIATIAATEDDWWEVEVYGWQMEVDSSPLKPIKLTRKYR